MKKYFLIAFLALCVALPASADCRIAVVDTGKAFDAYYKTKEVAIRIAAKEAGYKQEIEDLQVEYQQSQREAQHLEDLARDPSVAPDIRKLKDTQLAQKVQDLQSMEKELTEMTQARSGEIRDELKRSHEEIAEGIVKVIIDYVRPLGYDLVLDISYDETSKEVARLPYNSGKAIDITEQIIAKLNASAPPSKTGA